jgi:hypothetical protein
MCTDEQAHCEGGQTQNLKGRYGTKEATHGHVLIEQEAADGM